MGQARIFQNRIDRQHLSTRIDQLQDEERLLSAVLDIGGLYDSLPGGISGTDGEVGLVFEAGLGYRLPLDGKFGFRMDYNGFADFYHELSEYNLQEHRVAVEPQYTTGQFIWSLQLGGSRMIEDGRHDADSMFVSPAVTRLLASGNKAVSFYGYAATTEDKDDVADLNEDRETIGGGASFFFLSGETASVLISIEYANTDFEALINDYDASTESNAKRNDRALTAGIDVLKQIAPHLGLYANYSYTRNSSNVFMYDARRHSLKAGFSVFY